MTVVFDQTTALTGTDDGNGNGNLNLRQNIFSILLGAATGTQARVTVRFGTAEGTETPAISDMFIGQAAAAGHNYDFNGNQVRLTFSGGNTVNGSAAGVVTSDWVTLGEAYDNTKNYVISYHVQNGASCNLATATLTNATTYFDGGAASNAGTTVVTLANTNPNNVSFIQTIEIQAAGGTPIVVGQTPARIFLPRQGPDKGMRSPKAFPASPISLTLAAAQGTYTLTGQTQTLGVGMPAGQGSYSLTGFAATLSVVPNPVARTPPRIFRPDSGPHRNMRTAKAFPTIGSAAYSLAAAQGAYTLTGFSAILNRGIQMSAAQGSYTLTGQAQTLNRGILISAAQGSYTLNGQAVTPAVGMPAAQGSYALSGQSVTPAVGMPAAQGTYSLTGKPQAFAVALSILPQQGTYSLTGNAVVLTLTPAGGGGGVVHANPFFATPGQLMNLQ